MLDGLLSRLSQFWSWGKRTRDWSLVSIVANFPRRWFDLKVDTGLIEFLENSLVEFLPVEVARVGWYGFNADDCEASRICMKLLYHLGRDALLRPQTESWLTGAGWATNDD